VSPERFTLRLMFIQRLRFYFPLLPLQKDSSILVENVFSTPEPCFGDQLQDKRQNFLEV
jgi:hypothetical protein